MSNIIIAEFEVGEEIRFKATIYDYDGVTLIDPNSQTITMTIEDTQMFLTSSPTADSTGVYIVSYQSSETDPVGIWTIEWKATIGIKTKIQRNKFRVVDTSKR